MPGFDTELTNQDKLLNAIGSGDLRLVYQLLKDPNAHSFVTSEVLEKAVDLGHTEVVSRLLKFEGLDIYDGTTRPLLCLASQNGHEQTAIFLINHKRIDLELELGNLGDYLHPLVCAAIDGFDELTENILNLPHLYLDDHDGEHALRCAIDSGSLTVLKLLVEDPRIDPNGEYDSLYEIENPSPDVIPPAAAHLYDDEFGGILRAEIDMPENAFMVAARGGNQSILAFLFASERVNLLSLEKLGNLSEAARQTYKSFTFTDEQFKELSQVAKLRYEAFKDLQIAQDSCRLLEDVEPASLFSHQGLRAGAVLLDHASSSGEKKRKGREGGHDGSEKTAKIGC